MVDTDGLIHSCTVSKWYTRDGSRVPHLLRDIDGDIASLTGDRGYDQNSVYRAAPQGHFLRAFQRRVQRQRRWFIQGRMLCYLARMNGLSGMFMFTRFVVMVFISGGGNLSIISRVESRIHFIDTKQLLEGSWGQEMNKIEKWKRK